MTKRTNTCCMTLRLDQQLDDLVTEAAYDYSTSKSSWIRAAVRQSLGIAGRGTRSEPTRTGRTT